jgi:hypothetical protein
VPEPLELAAQDAKLLDMKLARRTTANVPCHRILIRQAKLAVGERLQQVGDLFTACALISFTTLCERFAQGAARS